MRRIKKAANFIEKAMNTIFTSCGFLAVFFVILITGFLLTSGIPAIGKIGIYDFLFGTEWAPTSATASYGILPFILTSVYGTLGAIIIGVPLGLMCAIFISKMANPKIAKTVRASVDLLSGIPSVVYGLVGMIIIVPLVRKAFNLPDGANLFSAIIVLTVMILPSVISVSETAIRAVPKEYEEASLALGATKTETVFKVIVPAAKSGILTSVALGIGRSIGEAMAVMMVSGNVANMPGLFKSVRFLTTAVASEMSYSSGLHREVLFSIALVLFVFILIINLLLNLMVKKDKR
ncbi:MAG: phosphate ABC transporter permease subunit PstC [Oscillospiraceae bacterium]|nr:phosphate ABC transporter permease subunit PstC [Oscillospiraceae bacterium]MBQ6901924.1 phosphate ABC transporter permease subunit PstC [Oscillospiraceae bacterium]